MKKIFLIPIVLIMFAVRSYGYTDRDTRYDNRYDHREAVRYETRPYHTACYRPGYYVERPVVIYRRPYYVPRYCAPRAYAHYYRRGYCHRGC